MSKPTQNQSAPVLYSLSNDIVKSLYNIVHALACLTYSDKNETAQLYMRLRLWMKVNGSNGFTDSRTSALVKQVSDALENGVLNIEVDEKLHAEMLRFVASKDQLSAVEKNSANTDHALEILGDIDYTQETLRDIARQAHAIQHMTLHLKNLLNNPQNNDHHDTIVSTLTLLSATTNNIHDRAMLAADELVSSDELVAELNTLDEDLILKTPHYQISKKGSHGWVENNATGEGRVIGNTEVLALLDYIEPVIKARLK